MLAAVGWYGFHTYYFYSGDESVVGRFIRPCAVICMRYGIWMKMASPDQVREATKKLLEATANYPNFILSTSCDVPPHIPIENIKAFYGALEDFNNLGKNYFSKVIATFVRSSLIGKCWGQTFSHLPHFMHSEAFPKPPPVTTLS